MIGAIVELHATIAHIVEPPQGLQASQAAPALHEVADCVQALNELYRVSDQVVLSLTSRHSITSRFRPGHKLMLTQEKDGSIIIRPNGLFNARKV